MSSSGWSDSQKAALVQQIVSGSSSLRRACGEYGISVEELKDWVCIFRRSMRQALDQQLRSTLSLQGLDLEELSRPEFSGNLADMDLVDLIQTIQLGRKDARITISHAGSQSYAWCEGGEIIDAEWGSLAGEAALYRILSLEHGSVVADFGPPGRARRIITPTSTLMLEAATHRDRRAAALRRAGDPSQVLAVVSRVAARHARDLGPEELSVLSLFDGARSLEQVVAASGLLPHQTLEIVVSFIETGVLVHTAPAPPAEAASPLPMSGHGLAMSYRPLAGTLQPEQRRPPLWVLTAGAIACSSLGAASAIAYANALERGSGGGFVPTPAAAAASAPLPQAPVVRPACPGDMVLIESGRFLMGTESTQPALQFARPAHPVSVDGFCIGRREVSASQYAECVGSGACEPAHPVSDLETGDEAREHSARLHNEQCNGAKPGREHHPINCVSHQQATHYCAFRGARLPTEAEWEFAARGEENRRYPWGDTPPTADHVNACGEECERWHEDVGLTRELHGLMYAQDDGYASSAPVGSFPLGSTPDGVMDLIGNVFEWTSGGLYAYDHVHRTNPTGPTRGESFVIRGGGFNSGTPEFSDPALRFAMQATSYSHGVGFRCADDPDFSDDASPSPRAPRRSSAPEHEP